MIASLRSVWMIVVTSVRVSKAQSLLCLAEAGGKLLMALDPLFLAWIATGLVHRDGRTVVAGIVGLLAAHTINNVLQYLGTAARVRQGAEVGFAFDARIADVTARIETIDHLEAAEYVDRTQALRDHAGALGGAFNQLLNLINNLVWVATTLVVAAGADLRLVILVVLGLARVGAMRWTIPWQRRSEEDAAEPSRLVTALTGLSHDPDAGAEARVFGLQQTLRRRLAEACRAWQRPSLVYSNRITILDVVEQLVFFGAVAGIVGWMLHDAIAGAVTVGALTIAVTSAGSLRQVGGTVVQAGRVFTEIARQADRVRWLEGYAEQVAGRHSADVPPPDRLRAGIRLEDVGYRYPGAERDAVSGVDLDIPPGTVLAVVGENGAGKSTLIKLLTGLHELTSGRILIDGVDLADLDLAAWRARLSGAFQDHVRLELTALHAVGAGDLTHLDDHDEVRRALDRAAADDVVTALPDELDTQLGTSWTGGVDLSGGQWQRLALGRGMMRTTPLLLVLDEPTSALDALTEHALFERYAAAARAAGAHGAITVLVTHRFSTVSAADLVVVLDRGTIAEVGSHRELMTAGGIYHELYQLQARGYH